MIDGMGWIHILSVKLTFVTVTETESLGVDGPLRFL